MIGTTQPKVLSDFYKKVFEAEPVWDEGDWTAFKIGVGSIAIGPHSDISGSNKEPARIMFNISSDDPRKEFDRIKAAGAKIIAEPYDAGNEEGSMIMCTFADLDGKYCQVTTAWE